MKKRKLKYLDHFMSNASRYHLLKSIIQEKFQEEEALIGEESSGWKTQQIGSVKQLFLDALNRENTAEMIVDIWNG